VGHEDLVDAYWLLEMLMHLLPKELQGEIELLTRICVRIRDRKQWKKGKGRESRIAMTT